MAQRKPWLVGLGVVLAALFLIFILTVVYAIWCSQSRDRWAPFLRESLPCGTHGAQSPPPPRPRRASQEAGKAPRGNSLIQNPGDLI